MPLNPKLHAALTRVFKKVKISNEGVPMSAIYTPGADGKPRLTPISKGEYYVVACPHCHDTEGHLYINHRWGVRDPKNGTRNLWLAHCFHGCLSTWERRKDLAERLGEYNIQARFGAVSVPEVCQAPPFTRWNLPGDFELLSELSKKHRATMYVRGRGFCPDELAELWGVGFSVNKYRPPLGRVVIPLYARVEDDDPWEGEEERYSWILAGYQGRRLDEKEEPKYLTTDGTPTSRLLYGLHRVPQDASTPVVVCEGPADVWRAGPGAVALFGKTISTDQCKLLRAVCPGRDVVIMLDPEAGEDATAAAARLKAVLDRDLGGYARPGRVVVASLTDERDPAECSRQELWDIARRALRRKECRKRRHGSR